MRKPDEIKMYVDTLNDILVGNVVTLTSFQIADITEKNHKHVIRDIKDEIEKLMYLTDGIFDSEGKELFEEIKYKDESGRENIYYKMGVEGIYQILSRYSAVVRRIMIQRVRILEKISRLGGKRLRTVDDLVGFHSVMKPLINMIADHYYSLSQNVSIPQDERNKFTVKWNEWSSMYENAYEFEEWWDKKLRVETFLEKAEEK